LLIANIFNIGADLGGMADAMQMVTGVRAYFWTPLFACAIVALLFLTSYRAMARVLKWLTLVLFAYVITAFLAQPDWSTVLRATFIPHIEWTKSFMSVLVGIFGTTISPYLFFWQAAEQVEEDREHGKSSVAQRRGSSGYPSTQNTGRFVPREEPDHHRHRSLDRRFLGRLHPAVHQGEALGAIGLCTWPAVL
jgi:Mn2+/Fe2+ NRAMP family transporter